MMLKNYNYGALVRFNNAGMLGVIMRGCLKTITLVLLRFSLDVQESYIYILEKVNVKK